MAKQTRLPGLDAVLESLRRKDAANDPASPIRNNRKLYLKAGEYYLPEQHSLPVPPPAVVEASPNQLPRIYRVTKFGYEQVADRRFVCTASLFHEQASMLVRWTVKQPDIRLRSEVALVEVRWGKQAPLSLRGTIQIDRLVVLERPERSTNLFQTIPSGWVRDRSLVKHGIELIERLPLALRMLFNAIFWEGERFRAFCTGPSSRRHHHAAMNGNLRHSLEVALGMRREIEEPVLTNTRSASDHSDIWSTDLAIAVLSGLLHDAGKADEYRVRSDATHGLSQRGRLLGHKLTVIEWIAVARARWLPSLSEPQYVTLIHNITAAQAAPDWLGIRKPATLAANYLSSLDRMSGTRGRRP